MIQFRTYKTPKEHLRTWVEGLSELPPFLDRFADLARDLLNINEFARPENLPNGEYFNRAKSYLLEKGETDAKVYLMRSPVDRHILRGSTRIPLRVVTKNRDPFIIKPYDRHDQDLEREVLATVSGKIGPTVLHCGKEFYAEEMIDFSRYTNLHQQCLDTGAFSEEKRKELWDYTFGLGSHLNGSLALRDRLMREMVETVKPILLNGARIHARLAQLSVIYDHNHWLDEFHVSPDDKPLVTDFGTSYLFFNPEEIEEELPIVSEEYRELDELYKSGSVKSREDMKRFGLICSKKYRMEEYQEIYRSLQENPLRYDRDDLGLGGKDKDLQETLNQDIELKANLLCAKYSTGEGIQTFFENVAIGSGRNYHRLIISDFEREFFKSYF